MIGLPPPCSARRLGRLRASCLPQIPCSPFGLRAEWREAVAERRLNVTHERGAVTPCCLADREGSNGRYGVDKKLERHAILRANAMKRRQMGWTLSPLVDVNDRVGAGVGQR
jgi:hypothetical protein